MIAKGHKVLFTCRDKEFEIKLLESYGLEYKSFGRKYKSVVGKMWGMIKFDIQEFIVGLRFKPDILLSHGSMYAAHASYLLGKPHISVEDTFNFEQIRLYKPFTKVILTSDYDHPLMSEKVVRYAGYHELAYLHPKRFTPDVTVLEELGVGVEEKYVIFRLVSWHASHDIGHKGLSHKNVIKAIWEFSKYARVFVSSESKLPAQLEKYKLNIAPNRIHDAIAFASLVFGESSTMSEEAAMLGVPSIYMFNGGTIYTKHLEKEYGLMFNLSESEEDQLLGIENGVELLLTPDLKEIWKVKKERMLADKIDVTEYFVEYIEKFVVGR